jgi:hypothetical protein
VSGTIDSTPNTAFDIDIFETPAAGATGHVEGSSDRQSIFLKTDASGHARFASQPILLRFGGPYLITATARGPSGTSEFSAPLALTAPVADLDGDSTVGLSDLLILAQNYGQPGTPEQGDLDLNGTVGFTDLLLLAQDYGQRAAPTAAPAAVAAPPAPALRPLKRARLSALLKQLA